MKQTEQHYSQRVGWSLNLQCLVLQARFSKSR